MIDYEKLSKMLDEALAKETKESWEARLNKTNTEKDTLDKADEFIKNNNIGSFDYNNEEWLCNIIDAMNCYSAGYLQAMKDVKTMFDKTFSKHTIERLIEKYIKDYDGV